MHRTKSLLLLAALMLASAAAVSARGQGIPRAGMIHPFPPAMHSGAPVRMEIWQWGERPRRKPLKVVKEGARIGVSSLPHEGIQFCFQVGTPHDSVGCTLLSSDGVDRAGWDQTSVPGGAASTEAIYHVNAEQYTFFPQIGEYALSVEARRAGQTVAKCTVRFALVDDVPIPRDTHYMAGRKDLRGNAITTSAPVTLGPLNNTPVLRDNDYPFEPQRAFHVINLERFPPFHLPDRFVAVWGTRRFTDEARFGAPLNRGFTALGNVQSAQDNLRIGERVWFHTPDAQVAVINDWYKQDPAKYADLKYYADYRSAFVSPENAYKLGRACYESWGGGGYAPYDAGFYGWDEEQMWPTIAEKMLLEHPEGLPAAVRKLAEGDPKAEKPDTLARLHDAYTQAWGDFIANGYRGARDAAAARGRNINIWHYGSKAPGEKLFFGQDDGQINPATGQYVAEEVSTVWPWFLKNGQVDYTASAYSREINYFNKDFYYMTLFPQSASIYEKAADGKFALDGRGRRKIRHDVIEENHYGAPVKVGYEDYEIGAVNLKEFVAKGENTLYWLNGGHTYKRSGTLVTTKRLIPTFRPGNQETWGDCAKLGSRPVCPYMAEASTIFTFMMGVEGMYLWDSRNVTAPVGYAHEGDTRTEDILGDMELMVKGMHRVSQLNRLFEGEYAFIRPIRLYDTYNRDHPIIRGILNDRYLALAMTNPYLDSGEVQQVEIQYGTPFDRRKKPVWSDTVKLLFRKNHIFQCKLPPLPGGAKYDPAKLYFRYTCVDGDYHKTYTLTGDYDTPYSF